MGDQAGITRMGMRRVQVGLRTDTTGTIFIVDGDALLLAVSLDCCSLDDCDADAAWTWIAFVVDVVLTLSLRIALGYYFDGFGLHG
jgi:hypothetical protein